MRTLTRRKRTLKAALNPATAFPAAMVLYAVCFLSMLIGMHRIQLITHDNVLSKGLNAATQWERRTTVTSNAVAYLRNRTHSSELSYVHERSRMDAPPVYMAIPTVPRAKDKDYLLKVLQSLENAHFPLEHVHVFYNDNPEQRAHLRWQQSETLFSSKGVHFLWNTAPVPPPHPAVFNRSHPLPPEIDITDHNMKMAQEDTPSRKSWRRKECNDFRVIMNHMLGVVYDGVNIEDPMDVASRDKSWVVFNQDDAQWNVEFFFIYSKLEDANENVTRWDISRQGLVSIALRAHFLATILEKAQFWCDFIPVDWMVWSYEDENHQTMRPPVSDGWIKHIGKVSSREGQVEREEKRKGKPSVEVEQKDSVYPTTNDTKASRKMEKLVIKAADVSDTNDKNKEESKHRMRTTAEVNEKRRAQIQQQRIIAQHEKDPVVQRAAADASEFDKPVDSSKIEAQLKKQQEYKKKISNRGKHLETEK